jgi:hypothetical protein
MQKIILKINNNIKTDQSGFAMLFTVLIVSLILSIAIGISNLSFKQTVLSSLAKDSQISFYEADTAIECGLYYDTVLLSFPLGTDSSTVLPSISCGNNTFSYDNTQSYTDYIVYKQDIIDTTKPCSTLLFDKVTSLGISIVQGRGYNICSSSVRQVERALEVRY